MDLFKNQGLFLTDNGYNIYNETGISCALLPYGRILIEFYELSENMDKFKTQMKDFPGSGEKVTSETILDYMCYFRDQLALFAPLIAEDWLDYILFADLKKALEKSVGKKTFAEITGVAVDGIVRFSTLASRLLEILSNRDVSPEDEIFFINVFKHQELRARFEKNSISGSADLLFLVEDFYSFIALEVHVIKKYNVTIRRCRNCEKWFIAEKSDTRTCDRTSPQYSDKTCKEAAKHIQRLKRENASETFKLYKTIYNTKLNRLNDAKDMGESEQINQLEKELYVDFIPAATKFKEDIKNGIRTEEEYLEWLRSFRTKK